MWISRIADKASYEGVAGGRGVLSALGGCQFLLSGEGTEAKWSMVTEPSGCLGVEHFSFSQITSVILISYAW